MKLLLCDAEIKELSLLAKILESYKIDKKVGFTYTMLTSSLDLLEKTRTDTYDVLFLDTIMPKFNGMQVAHELRTFDEHIKIVFLSATAEFAVESYTVKAYSYLLKPITKEMLYPILDELFFEYYQSEQYITIKNKVGIVRISFSKLSYVEVMGKTLSFHMCNGVIHNATATLSKYEEILLAHPEFIRVHRAFLVNLCHMQAITERNFVSSEGNIIPVSRRLYSKAKESYKNILYEKNMLPNSMSQRK